MSDALRTTVRAFLRWERPATKDAATQLLHEWFDRYQPTPGLLEQEVERYFSTPNETGPHETGGAPSRLWRSVIAPVRRLGSVSSPD